MGWLGYGIYSGDDTQTRHIDFVKWAKVKMSEDDVCECMALRGTHLPEEVLPLLTKNVSHILKKMPKLKKPYNNDDDAIEYQMLLALFLDNKIDPPRDVYGMGVQATHHLMGEHADDFDEPARRKKALRAFLKKAEKYCTSTKELEYCIVNGVDGNDSFIVRAKNGNEAAHKALEALGFWVAEGEEVEDE